MISKNFEVLKNKTPQLAEIAAFAESYIYSDPQSSVAKSRLYVEKITFILYKAYKIDLPEDKSISSLINNYEFKQKMPLSIVAKLNSIRKIANNVVHGSAVDSKLALLLLKEVYEVSRWFAAVALGVKASEYPEYIAPIPKKEAKIDSLSADIKLQKALDELEKTKIELKGVKSEKESQKIAVDELQYSEEKTRKHFIDVMLKQAGWDISEDGSNTQEVTQEEPVEGQPTATGTGYVDYVLWDKDGSPLAVIEAKKTSIAPEKGKKQASLYADALEKQYGRRPIIFYTNGFDTKIWDDVNKYPPRAVWGFYSKESLKRLIFQRSRKDIAVAQPDADIAGRDYQIRAIKAVCESFMKKNREALIVQATGTGKTRVSIALSKLLQDNLWAKRILFLCDRNALVKQAKRNYNTLLNSESLTILRAGNKDAQSSNIVFSTYPSMMNNFAKYDVGYFDLIIADESHRSIYNIYADIFKYFDGLKVGLTATPVEFVNRNTFKLFNCEDGKPTFYYSLDEAINEGHLVDYVAYKHDTDFLREGIHYNKLSKDQQNQIENDEFAEDLSVDAKSVDKKVMNGPTTKLIIRNLMDNGIKDADGQMIGKSIIFARNHNHAQFILDTLDKMYPQYGGKIAAVIDVYDGRADSLIDDFSDVNNSLKIAISVDMLDTGIDVPEVVNLVFAKPVKSKVKFWQMIGRGTRLRKNLFGQGKDKMFFKIFDHWQNFEYFDQDDKKKNKAPQQKSLMQTLFETKIDICKTAKSQNNLEVYEDSIKQIIKMINDLPEESISVKEKWREKRFFAKRENLNIEKQDVEHRLKEEIAPLMQWIDIYGKATSYRFDNAISKIQKSLLLGQGLDDAKKALIEQISKLPTNINQVKAKIETINLIKSDDFWSSVDYQSLEKARLDLRNVIKYLPKEDEALPPRIYNIDEDENKVIFTVIKNLYPAGMQAYKAQITDVLQKIIDNSRIVNKIKSGQGLNKTDFNELVSLILVQNPSLDKEILQAFFPSAEKLEQVLISISGMDEDYIKAKFAEFMQKYHLSSVQNKFLSMLQNQIIKNNGIELSSLYQSPFTLIDKNSIDGVFTSTQADEIVNILKVFNTEIELGL
ncbi:MAG: DEAD/DEAH box helicase family protein [Alphaproteobacteria bacterium]